MRTVSILGPVKPAPRTDELHRSFDAKSFKEVLACFPEWVGDPEQADDWLMNDNNVLLRKGDNYGMFTGQYPGVYTGHYFFGDARGRAAINLAREMLTSIFSDFGARSIQGLTPVENRKAVWMTRHLGFTDYGIVEYPEAGECHHFIITIDEFFSRNNNG